MSEQDYGEVMYKHGPVSDNWDDEEYDVAHRLLRIITKRINWREPNAQEHSGLGEALISPAIAKMPRRTYQNALKKLVALGQIQYGAVQPKAGVGTIVRLTGKSIYQVKIVTESAMCSASTAAGGASHGATATKEKAAPAGPSEPRNGKPAAQVPVQGQCNYPQNTVQPAGRILKNQEEEKEDQEEGAASPANGGGVVSISGSDSGPEYHAKKLAKDYPLLVEVMCGEFTALSSKGYAAAVEFFEYCPKWACDDVVLVGFKALEATKTPAGEHDQLWWCRRYAKDVTGVISPTAEEMYPILVMAREVGYDTTHYTHEEVAAELTSVLDPYITLYLQQQAERKGQRR